MEGTDVIQGVRTWVTARVGRQTLCSLTLLLIFFASLVYGVSDAVRGIERDLLWPIVLAALLLAWLLAGSRVRGRSAVAVSLVAGAIPLILYVGQLGEPLANLLSESAKYVWNLLQSGRWHETAGIQSTWVELSSGVSVLLTRVYTWFQNLVVGQPLFDPVPIALLWGLALWGTVFWAAWAVRRRAQPVRGVAPSAGLLASTLAYVGARAWYLLPMLASTLLLKALVGHSARTQRWQRGGVRYPRRVRTNTLWLALGLSVALTVLAAISPSISIARIIEATRSLTERQPGEEEAAESLGLEPQSAPLQAEYTLLDARRSGNLPTRHLIGSGPELSEKVVMVVSTEIVPTGLVTDMVTPLAQNYYWRSLTYERYTDRGWSAQYAGRVTYSAGEETMRVSSSHLQPLRQQVRRVGDRSGLLYVAGSLITADREFRVAWRLLPGEQAQGDIYGALTEADMYRADSIVPSAGEAELRSSGQDYPASIIERYLVLPDSIPDRVLALARDLTATEPTPYDRALAIERYLRRFPYTLDLPPPPADRDLVDYFLHDLRKGYCDYLASAMVVMARAAGLPARLVTGYATGTYDQAESRYVVTEANAHAWPEIYFPDYGWIEFEPTAGLPAIKRPALSPVQVQGDSEAPIEPIMAYRTRVRRTWWLGAAAGLLVLALGSTGVWLLVDRWRLRRLAPKAVAIYLYERLHRYGRWLGVLLPQGATPHEFAAEMGTRLRSMARGRHRYEVLDSAPDEVCWIVGLCTRALYSSHSPRELEQAKAIKIWNRLQRRLWLAGLLARIP